VGDARQGRPEEEPAPEAYLPYQQVTFGTGLFLVVRAAGDPTAVAGSVRRTIRALDQDVAIADVRTMEEVVTRATADSAFFTRLTTVFGSMALLLGTIGVYGVLSYIVGERLPEFGIRLALGSGGHRVIRLAIRRSMIPVACGIGVGMVGALGATRVLSSLLYGITATDPLTYLAVPVILLIVALAASYFPARRASRVDPARTLGAW
jgi:ABC-type antimicrobial peptide transport system permease subunit